MSAGQPQEKVGEYGEKSSGREQLATQVGRHRRDRKSWRRKPGGVKYVRLQGAEFTIDGPHQPTLVQQFGERELPAARQWIFSASGNDR